MHPPVYVINLENNADRLSRMAQQLAAHGTVFDRFCAIRGSLLTAVDRNRFRHMATMDLGAGEIGCLLSHAGVWQKLIDSEHDHGFVLEDDLHFAEPLDPGWLSAMPAGAPWVLRLETMLATVTVNRQPLAQFGKRTILELASEHGGSAAYGISRQAVTILLGQLTEMQLAVDTEMFSPTRRTISVDDLRIYQMIPAPCVQDFLLPPELQELGGKSDIGTDRLDLKRFSSGGMRAGRLIKSLKAGLRPAVRVGRSALLWPKGRARVHINFA